MTDGDQMEVAIFCLEQMWQATAIGEQQGAAETLPSWEDWDRAERYVLKLDHVNKACRILEQRGWPEPFPQSARNAAEAFVNVWQERARTCATPTPTTKRLFPTRITVSGANRQVTTPCRE